MALRVLIVDDHTLMRQGLRALLTQQAGLKVVGEAADGRTAVRLARELKPDVVIMDISMPDLNGVEATRQVVAAARNVKVLALSMHTDRRFVGRMLQAGASGYLLKDCAFEELTKAVEAVRAGRVYLSPAVAGTVVEDYVRSLSSNDGSADHLLTDREREVLQMLAEGRSTKETAARLSVSVKTVETHRRNVMDKLGLYSVAELTKYAIREGLTSPEK